MLTIKTTKNQEIIDITEEINKFLTSQEKENGLIFIFALHTTCALMTADLDPGADSDYLNTFEKIIPKLKYHHPHNPEHFPDHFLSSLIGTSLLLPFEKKNLILGTWQRVVLVELDGPRERKMILKIISSE